MINEYTVLTSEIRELEEILAGIPEENVIERMAFEDRLRSANSVLVKLPSSQQPEKAWLTFRGRPVFGSHGISADFGSKAAGAFADAFAAVVAGLNESLRYMGPIPDRAKNQLLITGTALGSFGFEFELPGQKDDSSTETTRAEDALQKMQSLFRVSAQGSDDDVAELVEEVHPRAVKKVSDFLTYLVQQQAWCGLEFKEQLFRFDDIKQLRASAARLQEENIHERDEEYIGEILGVLPHSRTFELKLNNTDLIIKGKVDIAIEDPAVLNREWLHKSVSLTLHVIQVGQGRPRFTLPDLSFIKLITAS